MTKKLVDIDEALLAEARKILGADSMKATVNGALAEVVQLARRRAHVRRLADGLDIDADRIRSSAWR